MDDWTQIIPPCSAEPEALRPEHLFTARRDSSTVPDRDVPERDVPDSPVYAQHFHVPFYCNSPSPYSSSRIRLLRPLDLHLLD